MDTKTETLMLNCKLTKDEMLDYAKQLVKYINEMNALEAEKSAINKELKERIEGKELAIDGVSAILKAESIEKPVDCMWTLDYEANLKTLTRTDTGEVINTLPLTVEDRQKPLAFKEVVNK